MNVCYKRSQRRLKAITATAALLLVILYFMRRLARESLSSSLPVKARRGRKSIINISCILPKVDPFNQDVMKHVRKLSPLKCSEKKRYGTVVGQTLLLDVTGVVKAEMKYIRRPKGDDFGVEYSEAIQLDITKAGFESLSYL